MLTYDQIVRAELSSVPEEERTAPKLSPTQAGLVTDPMGEGRLCEGCWMFSPGDWGTSGYCGQVGGDIKAKATCNFHLPGEPRDPETPVPDALKLGKAESGYMERPDFRCGGCARYDAEAKRCQKVFGYYDPEALEHLGGLIGKEIRPGDIDESFCCNLWTDGRTWGQSGDATAKKE